MTVRSGPCFVAGACSPKVSWAGVVRRTRGCRLPQGRARRVDSSTPSPPPPPACHGSPLAMDILHPSCAGLDVHPENVVACVRPLQGGQVRQEVRTFRTGTNALLELADWLT